MVLPSQTGNLQAAAENSRLGPSLLEQDHNSVQLNLFIVFLILIFFIAGNAFAQFGVWSICQNCKHRRWNEHCSGCAALPVLTRVVLIHPQLPSGAHGRRARSRDDPGMGIVAVTPKNHQNFYVLETVHKKAHVMQTSWLLPYYAIFGISN